MRAILNGCVGVLLGVSGMWAPARAQSWGTWEPIAPIPTGGRAKPHAVGLAHGTLLYVMGGPPWYNGSEDGSVYSYEISTGAWAEEIGFDGKGVLFSQGGGVDALNRIVIFGGDDPTDAGREPLPFEWDPLEGPWHDLAARGAGAPPMWFADCADDSGRLYSFGGGPNGGASAGAPNSTYAERYVGTSDTWQVLAPMPVAAADAAAAPDGLGHILVFGGIDATGSSRVKTVQRYDIATDSWSTSTAPMPVALSGHEAVLGGDGRVYVLGGDAGAMGAAAAQSAVHVYDPANDTWAPGPSMSEPRRWFAAVMGPGEYLYVFGGDNDAGGTASAERIYTTPCPVIFEHPQDADVWRGSTLVLSGTVAGGGTIEYAWEKDGVPVGDGASPGGGTVSGATTPTLRIEHLGEDDAGAYRLIASNTCGDDASAPAVVSVRLPPDISTHWVFTSLHPSVAESSAANAVNGGLQVGRAVFDTPDYNNIDHPWVWNGTVASGRNLTPPGSQGGSVLDVGGDMLVGWWWEPLTCYVNSRPTTCYYQRAARWDVAGNFYDTSYSGFEYTTMSATDGVSAVGSGSTDDAVGNVYTRAVIWPAPDFWYARSIHPTGYRNSSAAAVDGEDQYGTASLPFAVIHAAKWSGNAGTFVDMHPAGAANSAVVDASDGQQVGVLNRWTDAHAVLWSGTPESLVDLHPTGAATSSAIACDSGLQLGTVSYPDGSGGPVIWAGSPETMVEITPTLPPDYTSFSVADIDVDPNGTVSIVGSAYNAALGRLEAMLLTSTDTPTCVPDLTGEGDVNTNDFFLFLSLYQVADPRADFAPGGGINTNDFFAFLAAYQAGC